MTYLACRSATIKDRAFILPDSLTSCILEVQLRRHCFCCRGADAYKCSYCCRKSTPFDVVRKRLQLTRRSTIYRSMCFIKPKRADVLLFLHRAKEIEFFKHIHKQVSVDCKSFNRALLSVEIAFCMQTRAKSFPCSPHLIS